MFFFGFYGGSAWPFFIGGATSLVDSDNERHFGLLTSAMTCLYSTEVPSFIASWSGSVFTRTA